MRWVERGKIHDTATCGVYMVVIGAFAIESCLFKAHVDAKRILKKT